MNLLLKGEMTRLGHEQQVVVAAAGADAQQMQDSINRYWMEQDGARLEQGQTSRVNHR